MTVLIPAYKPNNRLLELVGNIQEICDFNIVIVDDGSGAQYNKIFKTASDMGCTIIYHKANKGKGAALKTGFAYIKNSGKNQGVVTADSDGQHTAADILRIGESVNQEIILGSRNFDKNVPLRSKMGNSMTRFVFKLITGVKLIDTQTGLRGFPAAMLDWLITIPGERYEYEMNVIIQAVCHQRKLVEIFIQTVYIDNNRGSHFNTFSDAVRVYKPLIKAIPILRKNKSSR